MGNVTLIPASRSAVRTNAAGCARKIRAAAYCRVSTDQEEQLNSFENQVEYYTRYIGDNPAYELAGIYADEGISGTNTRKRAEFNRMIADCEAGLIDLVITKSISRFARNTADCLQFTRKLKNMDVGVYFEKENINTLDSTGELLFTILSSLAQDESRNISENVRWGIRSNYKKGVVHIATNSFMGFTTDEKGNLTIDEEQAEIVRRVFREFLEGFTPQAIARRLNDEGVIGAKGKVAWHPSTIIGMLRNEKYMGDALLQKTFTSDFLTKKVVKNQGELEQYYITDSHPAIVSREDWEAAQEELDRIQRFKEEHGLKVYRYGRDVRPYASQVICGRCGSVFLAKQWRRRGVFYWQCGKRSSEGGVKGCRAENITNDQLNLAFISAWNQVVRTRTDRLAGWEAKAENSLQGLRQRQMIDLTAQGEISEAIPELVQMVLEQIKIGQDGRFLVCFLDGTVINLKKLDSVLM